MSSFKMSDLFFEVVSMMGIRGYNILPFKEFIDNRMLNFKYIQRGELDKVREIPEQVLLQSLISYRTANYQLEPSLFGMDKMGFSMIFDHANNGMRTLVLISNDRDSVTSKDTIVEFITSILKKVTEKKTEGRSIDPFIAENKISGIFILPTGVSSFSKTFLEKIRNIEIMTEDTIMSRVYDNCLQSGIRTVTQDEKNMILSEVGLLTNNIPSVNRDTDNLCKIMGLKRGDLMISTRGSIDENETLNSSIFIRNIN